MIPWDHIDYFFYWEGNYYICSRDIATHCRISIWDYSQSVPIKLAESSRYIPINDRYFKMGISEAMIECIEYMNKNYPGWQEVYKNEF